MAGGLVSGLFDWTLEVLGPWGVPGLVVLAVTEAFISPLPVEALLVPFSVADPPGWVLYGVAGSAGSVAGSVLGYYIGLKGGHPLLVRMTGRRQAARLHEYYERWGAGAVFITGITPLPYKVFVLGSGVLELDIRKFVLAATAGRGIRFMAIAWAASVYGREILDVLDANLLPALVVSAAAIVVWAVWAWQRTPAVVEEE